MRARVFVCRSRPHSGHSHTRHSSTGRPNVLIPAMLAASGGGQSHPGSCGGGRAWIGIGMACPHPGSTGEDAVRRQTPAPGVESGGPAREARAEGGFDGGPFGVRRPLRFLAERLALDDRQVREMAVIIDRLKTERAQAEVDQRRTLAAFADAVAGAAFDEGRAAEGGDLRLRNAERLRGAVLDALRSIHGLLSEPQREQLAYLIRTGILVL